MKRYLKVNKKMYFVQEEVKKNEDVTPVSSLTNHIFIYDRSQSMYRSLKQLANDLIERCKQITIGDTISIGWFSSEGKYNFILKGFKISKNQDYNTLNTAILNNSTTIGLTCFSEILLETAETLIKDLSIFSKRFCLTFFTDGYPVVSNYDREYKNIFSAIEKLELVLTSSLLVGYGSYYNKQLMSEMAEKIGGSLVHSQNLSCFNIALSEFITNSKNVDNKIKVAVDKNKNTTYFSISGGNVNVYPPGEEYIYFTPQKIGKNYLYYLTENEPEDAEFVKLTNGQVGQNSKIEAFIKGCYAAAYIMVQKAKNQIAIDILALLGDKAIIDCVVNAFTIDEYGKVEKRISECITSKNKRFLNGRHLNYLPKRDAFCIIDFVELLSNDDKAYFYPSNENFKYKRIGLPSVIKDGYPTFEANKNNRSKFSTLVWNKSRLNLSVLTKIDGCVKLKRNYKKFGFKSNKFEIFKWNNFTIVKDGVLNVFKLPLSFSEETFDKLQKEGIIDNDVKFSENEVYVINLNKMPIMNQQIAEENTSAKELFKNCWFENSYKTAIKVAKYMKGLLQPEKEISLFNNLSEEQVKYLDELGITEKGYSPPCEKVESTDYYYAKEFKILIKKFSSIPKIENVIAKLDANKPLTLSENLVDEYRRDVQEFVQNKSAKTNEEIIAAIDEYISMMMKHLRRISTKIQKNKFAVILGNQWFDEFDSRENCCLEMDGVDYEIKLENKKVNI